MQIGRRCLEKLDYGGDTADDLLAAKAFERAASLVREDEKARELGQEGSKDEQEGELPEKALRPPSHSRRTSVVRL